MKSIISLLLVALLSATCGKRSPEYVMVGVGEGDGAHKTQVPNKAYVGALFPPIHSLAGIEQADKIEHLNLIGQPVTDLRPLASLPRLRHLQLSGCGQVADLRPLRDLKLIELGAEETSINSLEPLRDMRTLRSLRISKSRVEDLSPLSGLTDLKELTAADLQLRGLDRLPASLQDLTITPPVDPGELSRLRKQNPQIRIYFRTYKKTGAGEDVPGQ